MQSWHVWHLTPLFKFEDSLLKSHTKKHNSLGQNTWLHNTTKWPLKIVLEIFYKTTLIKAIKAHCGSFQ